MPLDTPISVKTIIKVLNGDDCGLEVNHLLSEKQKSAAVSVTNNVLSRYPEVKDSHRLISVFGSSEVDGDDERDYDILLFHYDGEDLYTVSSAYPLSEEVSYIFCEEPDPNNFVPYIRSKVIAPKELQCGILVAELPNRWAKPISFFNQL